MSEGKVLPIARKKYVENFDAVALVNICKIETLYVQIFHYHIKNLELLELLFYSYWQKIKHITLK